MRVLTWPAFVEQGLDLAGATAAETGGTLATPYPPPGPTAQTAMTIGVFDGIHRGHQELIRRICAPAPRGRAGAPLVPTVVTFTRSPKWALRPETCTGDILSLTQKLEGLDALGIRRIILIDFSKDFSKLRGQDFIERLVTQGRLGYLAIGSNFRCGYKLDTDAARIAVLLKGQGIRAEIVPPVLEQAVPISSSRIRRAIAAGDLAEAEGLLGRPVTIDLRDCTGTRRRETPSGIGFAVASLGRLLPPDGEYRGRVYEAGYGHRPGTVRIHQGILIISLDSPDSPDTPPDTLPDTPATAPADGPRPLAYVTLEAPE